MDGSGENRFLAGGAEISRRAAVTPPPPSAQKQKSRRKTASELLRFRIIFIEQRRGEKAAQVDFQSLTKLADDPQLIAEIGDVRRFYSKKALVAYAGLDAPPNDSGDVTGRHKSMSKVGASPLRRTLFLVMSVYLQRSSLDEPIYQFMDRKRAEGKPYRVYMMASANKFLRIYYATVKAYLESLEHTA